MSDSLGWVDRFIAEIDRANSVRAVRDVLAKGIKELGFERFSFQQIMPPTGKVNEFYVSTYPPEWITRYNKQKYISHDVFALSAGRFGRPYLWTETGLVREFTAEQQQAVHEAWDFGIRAGASVPVYGAQGVRAHLAVASNIDTEQFAKEFAAKRHLLHLMTAYVHERLEALRFYGKPNRKRPKLTPRELEILTLSARGETGAKIGERLKISDETVTKHVQNACARLGAANRTHAVAIALLNRLILP